MDAFDKVILKAINKLRNRLVEQETRRPGYRTKTGGRKGPAQGLSDEESRKDTDLQRNPGARGHLTPTEKSSLIKPKDETNALRRLNRKSKNETGQSVNPATGVPNPPKEPKPEGTPKKKVVKKKVVRKKAKKKATKKAKRK